MIPIRHETSSYTNRDLQLFFRTWTPREQSPKYTVLLLHGWGDHSGRYMHVGQALARAGAMVIAPDLAGHGRSPGPRGLIRKWHHLVQDMDALLTHVGVTEPCAAFGHSMGGLLALTLADALPKRIKSLVLSSPLVVSDQAVILQKLAGILGTLFPTLPTISLDLRELSSDLRVAAKAESDPLYFHGKMPASTGKVFVSAMQAVRPENAVFDLPIFGFHGSADKLTSPEGSQFIFASARNPASEFSLLPGLRHETLNEDGAMTRLQSVVTWLEAQMA